MTLGYGLLTLGFALIFTSIKNMTFADLAAGRPGPGQPADIASTAASKSAASGAGAATGDAAASAAGGSSAKVGKGKLTELFHEDVGSSNEHVHVASCNRNLLIQLAHYAQSKYGLSIREFPPFDHVDCVHVQGSWHYRDSSNCNQPRNCSNRGNGLAFDASGAKMTAFYNDMRSKYGNPS